MFIKFNCRNFPVVTEEKKCSNKNAVLFAVYRGFHLFLRNYSRFYDFFPGFWKYTFLGLFSLELCKVKTVLSSITTLKRYCKATLNVFLRKNFLMMTIFLSMWYILNVKLKLYYLTCKNIVKNSRFLRDFFKVPGYSRITGFLAFLKIVNRN